MNIEYKLLTFLNFQSPHIFQTYSRLIISLIGLSEMFMELFKKFFNIYLRGNFSKIELFIYMY